MLNAILCIAGVFVGGFTGNLGMMGFALAAMIYAIDDLKDD